MKKIILYDFVDIRTNLKNLPIKVDIFQRRLFFQHLSRKTFNFKNILRILYCILDPKFKNYFTHVTIKLT